MKVCFDTQGYKNASYISVLNRATNWTYNGLQSYYIYVMKHTLLSGFRLGCRSFSLPWIISKPLFEALKFDRLGSEERETCSLHTILFLMQSNKICFQESTKICFVFQSLLTNQIIFRLPIFEDDNLKLYSPVNVSKMFMLPLCWHAINKYIIRLKYVVTSTRNFTHHVFLTAMHSGNNANFQNFQTLYFKWIVVTKIVSKWIRKSYSCVNIFWSLSVVDILLLRPAFLVIWITVYPSIINKLVNTMN